MGNLERFSTLKVTDDLDKSILSGVVMKKRLVEQIEQRVQVEIMSKNNSLKFPIKNHSRKMKQ